MEAGGSRLSPIQRSKASVALLYELASPSCSLLLLLQACYTHLIELMVRGSQPHLAVRLCSEAHEAGAMHAYALPAGADLAASAAPGPGAALGNVVDLRWAPEVWRMS